jgi:hypothetical protein
VRADEKSHRAAAEELMQAANMEKLLQASVDVALNQQIKANPQLAPFKDVMHKFLSKHMSYAAIKDDLIAMYVAEFTEQELKEVTAFYKTPTGRKVLEKTPTLMQKGGELGAKRVQDNLPELQKMIEEDLKKKQ